MGLRAPMLWLAVLCLALPRALGAQTLGSPRMLASRHVHSLGSMTAMVRGLFGLLALAWLLVGCDGGGSSGSLEPPPGSTAPAERAAALERAAVQNLLGLYRTAIIQEDIDRLQELLEGDGGPFGGSTFLATMATTFRRLAVTDLQLTEVAIAGSAPALSVAFQEALSVIDPAIPEQRTVAVRTRWQIGRQEGASGTVTLRIAGVAREGPQVEVTIRGQVVAGVPAQVEVRELTGTVTLTRVELEVPETGQVLLALLAPGSRFQGVFTPPLQPNPQPLRVRVQGRQGETVVLQHPYRLRVPGEGVVQPVPGTQGIRFFAVALTPDGTVWAGGDAGGTLVRVAPGAASATLVGQFFADPAGRVEDLTVDQLGRLHVVVFAPEANANGVIVLDQGIFCQTVNVFDPAYPFRVADLRTGVLRRSPSTRAVTAGGGDIWVFGSDGGVARVTDAFRAGRCPVEEVGVRYGPIFRREPGGLLSNTVPALEVGADGSLWFGTAFGLTRLQGQQFTPLPFDPDRSFHGDVATLEAFFAEVARALFEARPLTTVGIGGVSFIDAFGQPLVKEDLIFSLAEDGQERLWAGTLGGGLRRIEGVRDTLHLTRRDGLSSNFIFSLAVGPDGSLWVATEEGVSRLWEVDETVTVTDFSALDGLVTPVRDVAVGDDDVVWLATDGGLFRLTEIGGSASGRSRR